jgi:phospholipid/cholesterol/gamma-HCH transport system substrate-binding protein
MARSGPGRALARVVGGVVLAALVSVAYLLWPTSSTVTVSADFVRAVGLYPGSDVRILGVKVGQVDSVEPQGTSVRVTFHYDAKHRVPADAKALIVAPSLVSDRYVQLAPVRASGPTLADGARIGLDRTAVPVELDRVSQSLDDLMLALGPEGANRDGALSRLLETSAANLDGNGAALNTTVHDLSAALSTLSASRQDLFGTVANLQSFTSMLARNNDQVRRLNADLAVVAAQLSEERDNLKGALKHLGIALDEVGGFVKDNRTLLKSDVDGLVSVTTSIAANRQALAETLENAPTALSNLQNAYHPQTGTLDTRNNAKGLDDPLLLLCSILTGPTDTGNTKLCDQLRSSLLPLLRSLPVPRLPKLPTPDLPKLPVPGLPEPSVPGLPRMPVPSTGGGLLDLRGADPTLGGLLPGGTNR